MSQPIRSRNILAVILAVLSSIILGVPRADAQIATFESFSEGSLGARFVDPSGIIFTNPIYNFPGGIFSVDYGGVTNPPALPGNYLTGNAYSPGPAVGLTGGFGFTFLLPTPSTNLQMEEIYFSGSSWSIGVIAYAINGQQVLQTNILLPSISPAQIRVAHSVIQSAVPMSRVVVTTPSSAAIGFDNIGVPPSLTPTNGPKLSIVRSEANPSAVLFWPTNDTGFTLQSTTNLSQPIVWASDLPAPIVVGGYYRVTDTFGARQRYYRLRKP